MCLVAIAWDCHPRYRLVVAANRDEYYARPSAPAAEWEELPGVYGGRDLQSGGSWMAADRRGRLALVTNIRQPDPHSGESRGALVQQAMRSERTMELQALTFAADAARYRPFNLVLADSHGLLRLHGPTARVERLPAGIYGISNGAFDPPWPKTARLMKALADWCESASADSEYLLTALADRRVAADAELPDTGIGLERERFLSASFLASEHYGTRASSVLTVGLDGIATLIERSFAPFGQPAGQRELRWPLQD